MSNLLNRQRASDAAPDLQGLSRTQGKHPTIPSNTVLKNKR